MKICPIDESNLVVYVNLAHAYEAEFSSLTGKLPNTLGLFSPDTLPSPESQYEGYLMYVNELPSGFMVIDVGADVYDVCEFYVIPVMRRQRLGFMLADKIFHLHPGNWQVRQIQGARQAVAFWRRVIGKISDGNFQESIVEDMTWGLVTKQQFHID